MPTPARDGLYRVVAGRLTGHVLVVKGYIVARVQPYQWASGKSCLRFAHWVSQKGGRLVRVAAGGEVKA
jgi:hypothetical protein